MPDPNAILNYVVGRRIHPMVKETEDLLSGYNVGLLELAFPVQFNGMCDDCRKCSVDPACKKS